MVMRLDGAGYGFIIAQALRLKIAVPVEPLSSTTIFIGILHQTLDAFVPMFARMRQEGARKQRRAKASQRKTKRVSKS
ncbi:unnamed protein product [Sphenostylis stenocarpa]|uniref:Uncharacterized protein n=1 Tax=Sphenostylis stenocarpa TaxID=92480 RepID=A0AA86SB07_9FABA|nr:unnamed protein product [Sphenostylis stenocarpa]